MGAHPKEVEVIGGQDVRAMLERRYAAVSPGNGPRYVLAPEVRNQAGFGGYGGDGRLRCCDLLVMDTWQSGPVRLIGHEIKVSRGDWLRELKDPTKAAAFEGYVAEWWLVVSKREIAHPDELPPGWGLLAPAGATLRAVVPALRQPQPQLPIGLVAAMMRRVQAHKAPPEHPGMEPPPDTSWVTFDEIPIF